MKKIISLALLFSLTIALLPACGGGKEQTPAADSTNSNATVSASMDGKSLYDAKCTLCHGAEGNAGVMGAADLSKSTIDPAVASGIVKNGKNGMKAFAAELNDAQVDAVVKYVVSLRK